MILTEIYNRRRLRKKLKFPSLPLNYRLSLAKPLDNHESFNIRSLDDLPFSSR